MKQGSNMRVGISGYGKMGKIREKSILKFGKMELVALYDVNQNTSHPELQFCQTFEELLEQVDVVFIATYVKDAAKFTIQALKSGKHVFCEKPPAITASEVQKVIQAEKTSNRVLKYGFNHRYHNSVTNAKRLIDSGKLGKILRNTHAGSNEIFIRRRIYVSQRPFDDFILGYRM